MRILFAADTYYPHINGVYYFIKHLAVSLQEKGHEVAVIAPSASEEYTYSKIDNIDVYGMPSFSVLFYNSIRLPSPVSLKKRMSKIIKEFKPDIIHIQGHFGINSTVIKVNKKFNIPVIGTNHFMSENITWFIPTKKLKKASQKCIWNAFAKVFNRTALITTPTETGAKMIRSKLKVKVLPVSNGIDLNRFAKETDITKIRKKYNIPDKPILLSVGRLDPEKRLREVFEAAVIALGKAEFCLVVCGKGVEREALERIAKRSGIEESVIFAGFVPDEDLPLLYKVSTCFITASIAELQSLVTMEAMASGLPIIAADAGALCELVHTGINGYLFPPGDIKSIAGAITSIFNNKELQKEMSKKSLEYISEHDEAKTVLIYEDLYKKVIEGNDL